MADQKATRPSSLEDEYFVREDAEKKRKLAETLRRETDAAERERLRALHHMRCPKCGLPLQTVAYRGVDADLCFACGGVFLDAGEIDRITHEDGKGVMSTILGWLTRPPSGG